ncbi:MAG: hypothetical protein AAB227_02885 [Pseudomonadota bacterium]
MKISIWTTLDPELQSTLITQFVTIVLAVTGGFWILWRIRKDAEHARTMSRETEALKLKLRVYEDIASRCEAALHMHIEFAGYIQGIITQLSAYCSSDKKYEDFSRVTSRTQQLIDLRRKQGEAVSSLFGTIERWQIIDPRLDLFIMAFTASGEEIGAAFETFFFATYDKMPTETSIGGAGNLLLPSVPISIEGLEKIAAEAKRLDEKLTVQLGYITDLQIEMQNKLLGELFSGNSIPARSPTDKNVIVLTLDHHNRIKDRIFMETEGGKRLKQIKEISRGGH